MNKKISKVLSDVLYVVAALMLIYSIWSLIFGVQYIREGIAQEQIILEGNTYNIVSYFVQNFFMFFMYAVVTFGIGWIINLISNKGINEMVQQEKIITTERIVEMKPIEKTEKKSEEKKEEKKEASQKTQNRKTSSKKSSNKKTPNKK